MQKITNKLTVFFDDSFWVGIYERFVHGKVEVCKITFRAEPKDYEENKLMKKSTSRKSKENEKQRQYELRQKKRKEKHRGR